MTLVKPKPTGKYAAIILFASLMAITLLGCQRSMIITRITLKNLAYQLTHPVKPAAGKIDVGPLASDAIHVSFIGHSTTLINLYGSLILTDPNFSHRIGVLNRRIVAPGLNASELPPLDLILISHAHLDHFDRKSLKALPKDAILILPKNTSDLVQGINFKDVIEMGWGDEVKVKEVTIKAFRPAHWGRRLPWEEIGRGYNAYIISKGGKAILFAGDTAYTPAIGREAKGYRPAFAILPIGAYQPELWHKNHANPEEALQMFLEAQAEYLVPIHWGTFIQSLEPIKEPLERLRAEARRLGLEQRVFFLVPGETAIYPGEAIFSDPE